MTQYHDHAALLAIEDECSYIRELAVLEGWTAEELRRALRKSREEGRDG